MEDRQDLSARVTMLQGIALQWEHRLQSEVGDPEISRQAVAELRVALHGVGRVSFQQLVQNLRGRQRDADWRWPGLPPQVGGRRQGGTSDPGRYQ